MWLIGAFTGWKRSKRLGNTLSAASRIEDALHARVEARLARRGWVPQVTPYVGYGAPGWVRVMARVLLVRPEPQPAQMQGSVRGWRSFMTSAVAGAEVEVIAGSHRHTVRTDRGGYIDVQVSSDLGAGWGEVTLQASGAPDAVAKVRVFGPETTFGLLSDIDDTVLVTALPRPFLAAWNTFVLNEHARHPVPGIAVLYERIVDAHPDAAVMYLSTGAWNVAPTLNRFLGRHIYPAGPLLLTDWGPTRDGWFRNGKAHKRRQLRRLAADLPQVRWLLVGDDGQHDPEIYAEFARVYPEHVAGVAIRNLSPTEHVLSTGSRLPLSRGHGVSPDIPWVEGPNGAVISRELTAVGLLPQ